MTETLSAREDQIPSGLGLLLPPLFDRAPGLVVVVRGPGHVFEYANPAYLKVIGRDVIGKPVREAMPELEAQGFVTLLDKVFRSGEPFTATGMLTQLRSQAGDLEDRYFDFVYQPLLGAAGQVEGIFGQGIDVTQRVLAEDALRRSEARFADIFSQATVGIAQVDLSGRFVLVNDRQCEILGRTREELLGLTLQQVTHPDDLPENPGLFARLISTGEPFVVEKRYVRPDGSSVWVRNHVSRVCDAEGRPQYVTTVVVELTQEREAQLSLKRSEARSLAVLKAALDSVIIISGEGCVMEWNATAERTFGFTRAEALGRDLAELIIPPELREAHRNGMRRYLETGAGPVIGRRVEVEAMRRDGSRLPVELAVTPVEVDGKPIFAANLRDISARLAAETALREGAQRLKATYERAFAAIGEVDRDGRFLRVNEQFTAITGYSADELMARSIFDITHPDEGELEIPLFRQLMAGELPSYSLEKRYIHKTGQDVWVELSASTVDDAKGRPLYGVRVVRDITERRRWTERQRLLIDELNHRVKNTLATVQSIAMQTARGAMDPEAAHQSFLERLMALSRAHDILTQELWRGADARAVAASALQAFAGSQGDRCTIHGPSVWLEPRKALALSLALHELATNAAKHGALSTPEGRVGLEWTIEEGRRLKITWREEGGPTVTPPARRGFGSRLLERGLAEEMRGEVHLRFEPAGVVCVIEAKLSDTVEPEAGS